MASSGIDLGLICEWAYDERGDNSTTGCKNDLMTGARLAFNDVQSTEALAGLIYDLNGKGTVLSIESDRRISDHLKISVDAFFVIDPSADNLLYPLRTDDTVQVELTYFFSGQVRGFLKQL